TPCKVTPNLNSMHLRGVADCPPQVRMCSYAGVVVFLRSARLPERDSRFATVGCENDSRIGMRTSCSGYVVRSTSSVFLRRYFFEQAAASSKLSKLCASSMLEVWSASDLKNISVSQLRKARFI